MAISKNTKNTLTSLGILGSTFFVGVFNGGTIAYVMATNYQQIEASREIREWAKMFGLAAITAAGMTALYFTNSDFKYGIDTTGQNLKYKINQKLNKN